MKKKIVFVIPSLDAGGGEKSLVNLLNTIDYSKYEVDLLAFQKKGLFLQSIPKQVTLLTIEGNYTAFTGELANSILTFLKSGKWNLAFHRVIYTLKNKWIKNKGFAEQSSWKNLSKAIPVLQKDYDVAIGFLEKSSNYFTVDRIKAIKKIGWIHTNYSKSGMKPSFDLSYFEKLDYVVTVSNECEIDLQNNFPSLKNKFSVIHNIVSATLIHQLANETPSVNVNQDKFTIVTVARLSHEKGCDIAVECCKILVSKGLDVQWLLIGDGNERKNLEEKVSEYGLQTTFIFLGLQSNPYPFVKQATLYVQPSRYEGKSIAIDEAKILQKPIVVTNFDTAKDQLTHLKTGIISVMSPTGLADDILKISQSVAIQKDLMLNLSQENVDSEKEIEKLYALIHA